jgi:hypothetical protein
MRSALRTRRIVGAPQGGDLMSQDEQLGVLGRRGAAEQDQPAADPGEHQAERTDGHGQPSSPPELPVLYQLKGVAGI